MGVLPSDQRQHDLVRVLQRRGSQREDHVGETRNPATPHFMCIESDASIVAPLIFSYVLAS